MCGMRPNAAAQAYLASGQSGLLLAASTGNHHLARVEHESGRLWLSNAHYARSKSLRIVLSVARALCDGREVQLAPQVYRRHDVLELGNDARVMTEWLCRYLWSVLHEQHTFRSEYCPHAHPTDRCMDGRLAQYK
jgi:hypothetical protein